jgi:plasmid maintenance system antidote protein VapI
MREIGGQVIQELAQDILDLIGANANEPDSVKQELIAQALTDHLAIREGDDALILEALRGLGGVPHVADYIEEELHERDWSVGDLASKMGYKTDKEYGVDHLTVQMILALSAKDVTCTIGKPTMEKLAQAFGTSPELFVNLDAAWRDSQKQREDLALRFSARAAREQKLRVALEGLTNALGITGGVISRCNLCGTTWATEDGERHDERCAVGAARAALKDLP